VKTKSAATITVRDIPKMHSKGIKSICAWMRKVAKDIEKYPTSYSCRFTARYMYED
jgi:hypothetical protein